MTMNITMLGTAAGAPTPERGHTGMVLSHQGRVFLFDCGENAQVKLQEAGAKFMRINEVFITHFHGDHFFGLPGFLFSMSLAERTKGIALYGPRGAAVEFDRVATLGHQQLKYGIEPHEVRSGVVYSTDRFRVEASPVEHGNVPAVAYAFIEEDRFKIDRAKAAELGLENSPHLSRLQIGRTVEHDGGTVGPDDVASRVVPGRKVVYSGDTRPCGAMRKLAKGADVLVHESTYSATDADRAKEFGHSTTVEAATVAKEADVKRLILTHISKRYDDPDALLAEAREVFPATDIAFDLMSLEI
ncbi:MAG: ribonuclease Z [Methanopyri archaeon]|jgi:ribonuclease Z|nr:ribonuclease Z [Methanopyri archaeon]